MPLAREVGGEADGGHGVRWVLGLSDLRVVAPLYSFSRDDQSRIVSQASMRSISSPMPSMVWTGGPTRSGTTAGGDRDSVEPVSVPSGPGFAGWLVVGVELATVDDESLCRCRLNCRSGGWLVLTR